MSPIPITIQLSMSRRVSNALVRQVSPQLPVPPNSYFDLKIKSRPEPAFDSISEQRLLLGSDRVLRSLGDAELHDGLGFDLDGFSGLRIASHAGFAMRLHETAQAGHDEHAVLLGLFDRGVGQVLQKRCLLYTSPSPRD